MKTKTHIELINHALANKIMPIEIIDQNKRIVIIHKDLNQTPLKFEGYTIMDEYTALGKNLIIYDNETDSRFNDGIIGYRGDNYIVIAEIETAYLFKCNYGEAAYRDMLDGALKTVEQRYKTHQNGEVYGITKIWFCPDDKIIRTDTVAGLFGLTEAREAVLSCFQVDMDRFTLRVIDPGTEIKPGDIIIDGYTAFKINKIIEQNNVIAEASFYNDEPIEELHRHGHDDDRIIKTDVDYPISYQSS